MSQFPKHKIGLSVDKQPLQTKPNADFCSLCTLTLSTDSSRHTVAPLNNSAFPTARQFTLSIVQLLVTDAMDIQLHQLHSSLSESSQSLCRRQNDLATAMTHNKIFIIFVYSNVGWQKLSNIDIVSYPCRAIIVIRCLLLGCQHACEVKFYSSTA